MALFDPASRDAFEGLLREHLDALYRVALSLTRDKEEAEELVQEASVRALRNFHRFAPGTNARAWLITVLRNVFINDYRRKAKEREVLAVLERETRNEPLKPELPEAVVEALDRLSEEQRLAIHLFYVEGLSYGEIADAMESPIGTVMSRLHAARRKLIDEGLRSTRPEREESS